MLLIELNQNNPMEDIKNPITGYGLGATFSFFTLLRGFLIDNWYAHNFYLFILCF